MNLINELIELRFQQPGLYALTLSLESFDRLVMELVEFPFAGEIARRAWGVPTQVLIDTGGNPLWVLRSDGKKEGQL